MCNPALIVMVGAMVAEGYQAKQEGKQADKKAKFDARQLENEATMTRNVGSEEENKQRRATAELVAKQRARLGASNIAVDSGSGLQLQVDADTLGEVDALRIRSNFSDQAQVLDTTAEMTRAAGKAAKQAGADQFALVSGIGIGSMVNSKWFDNKSSKVSGTNFLNQASAGG